MLRRTLLAALPALIAACTPSLSTFNRFTPRDRGGRRLVEGESYGAEPRHKLDVYGPAAAASTPAPVIVFIYGGSWDSGARADYEFVGDAFAAQGFVTIIPDYRLVPDVRFPSFVEDCAAAVAWAHANAAAHGGDPNRIVIVGHSAGAYNTMMLALDARFLANAGVPPAAIV
jgi:acetyl esterase/lipase